MIDSLTVRKVATYINGGIQINDLKKINFIYGVNGSGKTIISKFLYNSDDILFGECSLKWKNDMPLKTLVYNKDFRDRNFGQSNIKGVFTLGQATKEEIEAIEKKERELQELKNEGITKKTTLEIQIKKQEKENDNFKESVWFEIYKKHEADFKEVFKGVMQKESFKKKLLSEYQNNKTSLLSYEELKKKANTIFGKTPEIITKIPEIGFEDLIEIENDKIWQKKIIGKADIEIAKLIQRLNLNDWVNEGRTYLQDDNICPFCQQKTITENFRKQLEDYFDEIFNKDTKLVKENIEEYNRLSTNLINKLTQIESDEKAKKSTKLILDIFSAHLKTLSSQFFSNKEILNNKNKEPSRSVELISVKIQLENIRTLIITANQEIEKHNIIVNNYATEKRNLITSIWKYLINENKLKIDKFIKLSEGLQKGIDAITKKVDELRTSYKNLDNEIKELNKNVTSIKPSIDKINSTLKSYGFQNFEIVPSKTEQNQYQIQREDGTLAESTLSEGEITFITFLYFLQLAKGSTSEDSITEERILVIDDPISSLDSNVLFVVSSLLKEIMKSVKKEEGNIKQIILLTHNVYFHKEVSFIDGRTKENGDTFYWILRKNNNCSSIQAFEMKNPIQNSYELLWQELRNKDNISKITIQNTMRRIIENYFKILGKYGDDDLIEKFTDKEEQEICRSLLCWINDGSHSIPDDLFIEHQENIINKYFEVFKSIFVHTKHIEHYKMMMKEEEIV